MKIGLDVAPPPSKASCWMRTGIFYTLRMNAITLRFQKKIAGMLSDIAEKFPDLDRVQLCISGSAGMGIANDLQIPFVQEVYATRIAVNRLIPGADVIIELGGEDAKILFLTDEDASYGGLEVRMNGSCAGGTGASSTRWRPYWGSPRMR